MAVAKSTINKTLASSVAIAVNWSSLASDANNVYFDVKDVNASKMILLIATQNSTNMTATSTGIYIYLGASASASSGSCWARTYSGRGVAWSRKKLSMGVLPSTDAKEALITSAAATPLGIVALGPFETARFKDSDGYINLCKAKGAETAGKLKVAAILIP